MSTDEDLWHDVFHGCAWVAFVDQAVAEGDWPDSEATRQRAYRYYEEALATRNKTGLDRNRRDQNACRIPATFDQMR